MTEAVISGALLFLISTAVLTAGLATGEMPFNYKALDTNRITAPATFWAFVASWTVFAVLGLTISVRHWGG
jgi:hypothetical protein